MLNSGTINCISFRIPVKRNKEKYYLMRNQDIPSKETGTWADYWVNLAAYN